MSGQKSNNLIETGTNAKWLEGIPAELQEKAKELYLNSRWDNGPGHCEGVAYLDGMIAGYHLLAQSATSGEG